MTISSKLAPDRVKRETGPTPFIKWAGGKTQLLERLSPLVPREFGTYHEPFLGGGALYFHLRRERGDFRAVLTDMNADVVNAYCVVRDSLSSLVNLLKDHKDSHGEGHYYSVRELSPGNPIERAARFIYLNKTCYNGLYRVNSQGHFNVPMGSYKNPAILEKSVLEAASAAIQNASVAEADFASVARNAARGDFVYLDPPYFPLSSTSNFTGYVIGPRGRADFGASEHQRLARVFKTLDDKGCYVLLSNSDTRYVKNLYQNYDVTSVKARRSINSSANGRAGVLELVIKNYN